LATKIKDDNWIPCLIHPPQSPDLNPIKAYWNIIKPRVRKRTWRNIKELKAILQEEWAKIIMEEIRARIMEMPQHCKDLVEYGGKPLKSDLW
jgi:transposase